MNLCTALKNMGSKLTCVCWYEVFVNMMMIILTVMIMHHHLIIVMIMIIVIIVMIIISNGTFVTR